MMKKLLLSVFATLALGLSVSAQKDISITLTSPANGDQIDEGAPFNVVFTVTNAGTVDIVATDSVYWGLYFGAQNIFGNSIFLATRTQDTVPAGGSWNVTIPNISFPTINDTVTNNMCIVGFLYEGTNANPSSEPDSLNNISCATVTLNAGAASTVSLEENVLSASSVSVYPNPATDVVTFETFGFEGGNIVISTLTGQKVAELKAQASVEFNVSTMDAGIYIYSVSSSTGEVKTGKITVK